MTCALRRTRRDDLLARREKINLHLFAVEDLLLFGSRRDDRRRAQTLHRDERQQTVCG